MTTLKPERFSGEPKTNSDRPPIKTIYTAFGVWGDVEAVNEMKDEPTETKQVNNRFEEC